MRRLLAEFIESLRIAVEQILQHKLRAGLTALGVIIGILAVTLMGTAVKGISKALNDSLEMIGTDVFYVSRWPWRDVGDDWRTYARRPNLTPRDAERLNNLIKLTGSDKLEFATVSSSKWKTVRHERNVIESTEVIGADANYMRATSFKVAEGRFLSPVEADQGLRVAVLGSDVASSLFPEGMPINRQIIIDNLPFTVIGTLQPQGEFLGLFSMDRRVVVPELASRKLSWHDQDVDIIVKKAEGASKEEAKYEIEDLMRRVRGLLPEEPDDFEVNSTDIIEDQLGPVKAGVSIAGLGITGMSLFVGMIGIMNITFVSVRERTREIGTRRALGAPRRAILIQFLVEAVSICVIGGAVGLGLAYAIRAGVGKALPGLPLVFSGDLIIIGLVVSMSVGILSGIVPAWLASRMDPATALRHD